MYTRLLLGGQKIGVYSIFIYLIFVVGILVLAYITTFYVAKFYKKGMHAKNIKIIERVHLAADKSLWLIELGEKHYFIFVDKNGMTKIDELNSDALNLDNTLNRVNTSHTNTFSDIFIKHLSKRNKHNE